MTEPAAVPREGAPTAVSTVLIIDDDEPCRQFLAIALRGAGCSVLVASGGPEALQVVDTYPGPIHLLLSDVVMPGMGGRELVALLLQRRPDARVLFISGYVDDPVLRAGVSALQHRLLQKPFSVAAVREALAQESVATPSMGLPRQHPLRYDVTAQPLAHHFPQPPEPPHAGLDRRPVHPRRGRRPPGGLECQRLSRADRPTYGAGAGQRRRRRPCGAVGA